jgi:uridine kinase
MSAVLPSYLQVADALAPTLQGQPGVVVTIDGRDGVGKTRLGRFLAWYFNVTLIETDLFLIPAEDYVIYLDDQINRIIERRVSSHRPVIVEGIAMMQLMQRINRTAAFSIYVENPDRTSGKRLDRMLSEYEAAFAPSTSASLVVTIDH